MTQYNLSSFVGRSSSKEFREGELALVLDGLQMCTKEGPWLAGGALRRTLMGQEPDSDFDFFFRDAEQLSTFTTSLETKGLSKLKETEHHVHYRGQVGASKLPRDIQCIRFKFYKDAAAVIDSFDFTICQFAFDGEHLITGEFSLWDLGRKKLAVHKITYPVSTMRRLLKYTNQGFTACNGALQTILRATVDNPELRTDIEYVD